MMARWFLLSMLLFTVPVSFAAIEVAQFDDPAQEQRYKALIAELRCLVCQNQNLADSNAELAQDMRKKTYQMVKSGASKDDVVDFMVKRYGDFVMYRPPLSMKTLLLWIGPFVILLAGVFILLNVIRNRNKAAALDISDADLQRARSLLGEEETKS